MKGAIIKRVELQIRIDVIYFGPAYELIVFAAYSIHVL